MVIYTCCDKSILFILFQLIFFWIHFKCHTYLRNHSTLTFHLNSLIRQIPQNMLPDKQHRRLKRKRTTDILEGRLSLDTRLPHTLPTTGKTVLHIYISLLYIYIYIHRKKIKCNYKTPNGHGRHQ